MEKTIKISVLLLILTIGSSLFAVETNINRDGLTEYQKERSALVDNALTSIVSSMNQADQYVWTMSFLKYIETNQSKYMLDSNDNLGMLEMLEAYISEICGVMPWIIGNPDNTLVEEIQARQYNSVCKWYFNQRKLLDERQTAETLSYERQIQINRTKQKASTNRLEKIIRQEVAKWLKKGEYEKTIDYQQRVKERSKFIFDSICSKVCAEHWMDELSYRLLSYNADTEQYKMILYYSDNDGNLLDSISGVGIIPTTVMSKYKDLNPFRMHKVYKYTPSLMVKNGYIYPQKYKFKLRDDETIYTIDFSNANGTPVEFFAKDLGFQNEEMATYSLVANTDLYYSIIDSMKNVIDKYITGYDYADKYLEYFFRKRGLPQTISASYDRKFWVKEDNIPCLLTKDLSQKLIQITDSAISSLRKWNSIRIELEKIDKKIDYDTDITDEFIENAYKEYIAAHRWKENYYIEDRRGKRVDAYTTLYAYTILYAYSNTIDPFIDAIVRLRKLSKSEYLTKSEYPQKYYRIMAEQFVTEHKEAAKEYEKNGQFFKDKVEFFETYCFSKEGYVEALKKIKKNRK